MYESEVKNHTIFIFRYFKIIYISKSNTDMKLILKLKIIAKITVKKNSYDFSNRNSVGD